MTTFEKGDRLLAVHPAFGNVEGVYDGWGIQDDGTRYVVLLSSEGRREIPLRMDGDSGGFEFHLLTTP